MGTSGPFQQKLRARGRAHGSAAADPCHPQKRTERTTRALRRASSAASWSALMLFTLGNGCSTSKPAAGPAATTQRAPEPDVIYDTTLPKPVPPRDVLERWAQERGGDFRLVDRVMDPRSELPPFERRPLPPHRPEALIAADVPLLDDADPFAEPPPLEPKEVSIRVGIARSTYRTREPEEVLSAVQPFIDLVQREVNVRGEPVLYDTAEGVYFGLLDGEVQMAISHVFDYWLVRSWFADSPDNGTILLAWAQPARPRTGEADADFPGVRGTSIEIVVGESSPLQGFADLKGKRLAVAVNAPHGPGTFLTSLLAEGGYALDQPFFAGVSLRRYPKDALIDVIKGKADAACVEQGTVGALDRFYGIERRLRTLAVSPRYNVDVLYTTLNNVATHRTEIELTQSQLTTLGKDPEGQEVLFFFDTGKWHNYRKGDLEVPGQYFEGFLEFIERPPSDLKAMLDPDALVDRRTYNRYGDE